MKRGAILLLFLVVLLSAHDNRPKVGLVLSGGGARGFAHVGLLSLVDSLNIPVDYIAGTSMGAIMGALYSIGYDPVELEHLIRNMDWESFFSDEAPRHLKPYYARKEDGRFQLEFELEGTKLIPPSGLISGQKIRLMLSEYTYAYENVKHFDELPIPFRAVAVDLITANEVILQSGSLSKALRSTMSIPSVFAPVEWGDSLLIDGGLLNNVPTDVAQDMGADIIIACNTGRPRRDREKLKTLLEILEQSITIPEYLREDINLPLADVLLSPNLSAMSPADFSTANIDAILAEGFRAADSLRPLLENLVVQNGLSHPRDQFARKETPSRLFSLQIKGNTTLPFRYLYQLSGLTPGDSVDVDQVESQLRTMRGSERIHDATYTAELVGENDVVLTIQVQESDYPEIRGIHIRGNESLPYSYIFQLLDIHGGDPFIPVVIAEKITQLHSLGVFKTVDYEIEPIDENNVNLSILVQERSTTRLHLGMRYDDLYNLVGHVGIVSDNLVLPGLRLESSCQFAGRDQLDARLLFPISFQGWMTYPFIHGQIVRETRAIYDFSNQLGRYHSGQRYGSVGIGLHPSSQMVIEFEAMLKAVDITNEAWFLGGPEWNDLFTQARLSLVMDNLDDPLIPHHGEHVEFRMIAGLPDLEHQRYEFKGTWYRPLATRANLQISTHLGYSAGAESRQFDWFHGSLDHQFVGMHYYEMAWKRYLSLRVDYRLQLKSDWYAKFIYNVAPNPSWKDIRVYPTDRKWIDGAGVGVIYDSILGPMEATISVGEALNAQAGFQTLTYFTIGYRF